MQAVSRAPHSCCLLPWIVGITRGGFGPSDDGRAPSLSHGEGEGWEGCFFALAWKASAEHGSALPLVPSLSHGEGEGWGGGLSCFGWESLCRAWLGTTACALPFAWRRGGLGGVLFALAGKASAEHGSALPLVPSLSHGEGEGWEGCFLLWLGKLLPSMARHYRLCPPFRMAKGRVGEGCFFALAGKASAEHGSALPVQQ